MGLTSKFLSKVAARDRSEYERKRAVIVGKDAPIETQQDVKFAKRNNVETVYAQRYRIRILDEDPFDKPEDRLPVAYPLQTTSGLGAQSDFAKRYPPHTYVEVSLDPNSGSYYIEKVLPNVFSELTQSFDMSGAFAYSGFLPGDVLPTGFTLKGKLNYAELFNTQAYSDEDIKHIFSSELPSFTSACKPVNTAGVNDAITNLIKNIESLRTGIVGEDSFLATSGQFIRDAQSTVNGAQIASDINIGGESFDITLGNAAGDIANIIAALVQQMRKWILRKISSEINLLIGNVPLSARYLGNEATDKALSAISCLFYRVLKGLEEMILNILRSIVDKIVNAADCLLENLFANIIGNIIGSIVGAINSILSSIGALIGGAIDFANELLDFAISILDFAKCPVKNECPPTDHWDFVDGTTTPKKTLDFNRIFEKAKGIADTASNTAGTITTTFEDIFDKDGKLIDQIVNFTNADGSPYDPLGNFNPGSIFNSVLTGNCYAGPVDCGPPTINFFGGTGSGGAGNAVVNALGEVLGVQILFPGNYSSPPLMTVDDNCGNGKGANGTVIIGPVDTVGTGSTIGIVDVVMNDTGYDYHAYPYGDKGGSGRVWADRCQSTVLRANFSYDIPYSNGDTVTVFYGDTVTLPGQDPVTIDENFTEDKLPGCVITGTNPKLKDMTSFDYTHGKVYETGIRHQFGLDVDAQRAFAEGFTEQDIRFFLENKFFLRVGPKMRQKLLDPNWGKIPEFSVTFTAPGCPPGTPEDPNEAPGGGNFGNDGDDVIAIFGGVVISNPGFGYNDGDTLLIDGGAEGNLIITNGAITGVNITNPGIGYTTLPEVKINTNTGNNAILKPVLRFISPNNDEGFVVPLGTPTLKVIDCVGKV